MAKMHKNRLLVEGVEDLRVIPELVEINGINWGSKNEPIVQIHSCNGYENIADVDAISAELNNSGLEALGIIIDADTNPKNRWLSLKNASLQGMEIARIQCLPELPAMIPEEGLIRTISITAVRDIRFGIWMMPDNQTSGMLETFLSYLLPEETEELWGFAKLSTTEARQKGAKFTETHYDKAQIYTWLAWQEPPGRQLHDAIKQKILHPTHPRASVFMQWFRDLYQLDE
jgi:hypothetical protein